MPVKQLSVMDARDRQAQGATYLDVRSTSEFSLGHPAGAVNVPLLEPDEDTGQMSPNPDFLRVVQANFPVGTPLLVGCHMGGRSLRAAQILDGFGYTDVTNVRGGFAGARDPMSGAVADAGWADAGLPVERDVRQGAAYRDLLAKADAPR